MLDSVYILICSIYSPNLLFQWSQNLLVGSIMFIFLVSIQKSSFQIHLMKLEIILRHRDWHRWMGQVAHGVGWYRALMFMTLPCVLSLYLAMCIESMYFFRFDLCIIGNFGTVLYYDLGGCPKTYVETHVVIDIGCVTYVLRV